MPTIQIKPTMPLWQPGLAPAGTTAYYPLTEGGGFTVRDYARRPSRNGTFIGAPPWQRGLYGPQLGGFDNINYVDCPAFLGAVTYPYWTAALFTTTSSTDSALTCACISTLAISTWSLRVNRTSGGTVCWQESDNNGTLGTAQASLGANDGKPHVAMGVTYGTNDRRVYFDGRFAATDTTALLANSGFDKAAIGIIPRSAPALPFQGSIIAALFGRGLIPDPMALANDLLSGRFLAIRPRPQITTLAAAQAVGGVGGPTYFSY